MRFIKKILSKVLPRPVKKVLRRPYKFMRKRLKAFNLKRLAYLRYHKTQKIKANTILYESYAGAGMICNPYAIFKELLNDESFKGYKHYWAIREKQELRRLKKAYKKSNVFFIKYFGFRYLKKLANAQYLINNTTFTSYFAKKKGQVYVNTWHSTTLKALGFDMPQGIILSQNILRNFMMADYITSPNAFMSGIFKKSYKLEGLYDGIIIEEGFPRNDLLLNANKEQILRSLKEYGIDVDSNKKIILYAPTWKGKNHSAPEVDAADLLSFEQRLRVKTGDKYQVLTRPHHLVYARLPLSEKKRFIPASMDTNEVLSIVDILISDYSSIAFDYLNSGKPMLFYIPDLKEYEGYRGICFKPEELPGPGSDDIETIAGWINDIENINARYKQKYEEFKTQLCAYEDGKVASRIVDCVFNKNSDSYRTVNLNNNKKKILIYGGVLKTDGVTTTLINRLNSIDYKKFDVSLIAFNIRANYPNLEKINKNVRVFCRLGGFCVTLTEALRWHYIHKHGMKGRLARKIYPKKLFERELTRCIGDARFDYLINYSGYSALFAHLFAAVPGPKKIIWQHTDLLADANNSEKAKQKTYTQSRRNIFSSVSTYRQYDKIVSVGKSLMERNRESLANEETEEKFTYVNNLIGDKRVLKKSGSFEIYERDGAKFYCERITDEAEKALMSIPLPDGADTNFVTMGRLSAEKNHLNLIEAFSSLIKTYPACRLYIIGGGDLKPALEEIIAYHNLQDKIILTGMMNNPFGLMKRCDCFVFPSLYEGFGMAVLEARVLNMPIIISNFTTAKDLFLENGQIVVDFSAEGILKGMKCFIEGGRKMDYHFDAAQYNREAKAQFDSLFK